jgi:transcriptional regulator with XRE-family HTH domain
MSSIGERVKALRIIKKVTQKEVAEGIGVNPVSVQRFEYGSVRPSLDTLIALADYFDVSLDYLCGRSDNPDINR